VADKKELLLIEIREDGARVVKKNIADLGAAGDATTNQMNKLKAVLGGLVSAKVIKDTIMLADAYANMLNRLRVVTSGQLELRAAMEAVWKMSRETRTSLEANVDMYARVAINTRQMGLGMQDVVRFATQLNHAIILSGVTAREAQWGMVQFSQALASNALRGDELRAVLEQLPIVTDVLAEHFGVTRGELRELGFQGRITSREIIAAFNKAEESLRTRFLKRLPTIDQGITVIRGALTKFVGDMDQLYKITMKISNTFLWLSDNMENFGRVLGVVGIFLGTVFLKNLIGIVAQMKLFNLSLLKAHALKSVFALGAVAMVVYADKIKIASDSSATLADTFKALGERAKVTYKTLREGIADLFNAKDITQQNEIMLEDIMKDVARAFDWILGHFVGWGQVVKKVFMDIPSYAKMAWNGVLSGVETVKDVIVAVFKAIGDAFKIFGLNMKTAMISMSAAMKQMFAGNIDEAARFADQAELSLKNAAAQGFGNISDLFSQNLERAASEDSLAGAKFKIEAAGETLGQAFMRGFGMSDFIEGGVTDMFNRAKEIAASREGGTIEQPVAKWSPTPIQSELLKEMSGNAEELTNKMNQLREMWNAFSKKQPGTDNLNISIDQVNRKLVELKVKSMETATGVVDGFKRGFMKLSLEMTNFATVAEKTIVNAFSRMEDAIVELVTTGKMNVKRLVDSILADLTRLLTRQVMSEFMKAFASDGEGGGGVLSMLGGGGTTPTRQMGGYTSPGSSYIVGERRPEIFTPAQPGRITPKVETAKAEQSPFVIINVSSEEDAKAAAASYLNSSDGDRLIQNKMRVYQGRS